MIKCCSLWCGFFHSWLSWNEVMASLKLWGIFSVWWSASCNSSWSQIWRLIFEVSPIKITNGTECILIIRSKWILNIDFSWWRFWFRSFSELIDLFIQSGSIHICLKRLISKNWFIVQTSVFKTLWWWLFCHIDWLFHYWLFFSNVKDSHWLLELPSQFI